MNELLWPNVKSIKRTVKAALFLLLSVGAALSAEPEPWKEVGAIPVVDKISDIHISNLLWSHGIDSAIVGSVIYAIKVLPARAAEATKLLRDDAPKRRYQVWLAETNEIVGVAPEPKELVSRSAVATVLKQPEFSPKTTLGRFLRSKDITRHIAKYPFIISLRVVERQYLATTTDIQVGYNVDLDLQKSLRDRDDDFGGTYHVYDAGKCIKSLGSHEGTFGKQEQTPKPK